MANGASSPAQQKFLPQAIKVGRMACWRPKRGLKAWFIPGSFRFCLGLRRDHTTSGKDSLRLTSLSGEGRSSATTMLTLGIALRYLYEQDAS
jgi:hypothetical protein